MAVWGLPNCTALRCVALAALEADGQVPMRRQRALAQRLDRVLVGPGVVLRDHLQRRGLTPDRLPQRHVVVHADVVVADGVPERGLELRCAEPTLDVLEGGLGGGAVGSSLRHREVAAKEAVPARLSLRACLHRVAHIS